VTIWATIAEVLTNIPPFGVVFPDEGGVFLRGGKFKCAVEAGFYWKWPYYDSIRKIDTKEQVVDLDNEAVSTRDGITLGLSGVVTYEVENPRLAILNVRDYDESLQTIATQHLCSYVSRLRFADLTYDNICAEVLSELRVSGTMWGLDVTEFGLNEFSKVRVLRLLE